MPRKENATRSRLLAAADEVIYRRGYACASFDEMVSASGLRRGHINYYFATKDDLLDAVVGRRIEEVRSRLGAWDAEVADPAERLRRFTDMILGRRSDLARSGCPVGTLAAELGKGPRRQRALGRKAFEVYAEWLAAQIRALGWRPADARERAMEMLARCQGAALLVHAYGDPKLLGRRMAALRAWIDEIAEGPRRAGTARPRPAAAPRRAG